MLREPPIRGQAETRVDYSLAKDEELVVRVAGRDERALERLYERYGRAIYSLVLRMLRDPARAEEITQEVYLKLWRRPSSFSIERGAFATWFLSVAHHRAIDELRSRRMEVYPLDDGENPPKELVDDGEDLADIAWLREQRVAIRQAIAALPDAQREVIDLAYFAGLTQREIAKRTGEPLGTVKTRIRLAILKLRTLLSGLSDNATIVKGSVQANGIQLADPIKSGSGVHLDLR